MGVSFSEARTCEPRGIASAKVLLSVLPAICIRYDVPRMSVIAIFSQGTRVFSVSVPTASLSHCLRAGVANFLGI